jgi:hypothetical protein
VSPEITVMPATGLPAGDAVADGGCVAVLLADGLPPIPMGNDPLLEMDGCVVITAAAITPAVVMMAAMMAVRFRARELRESGFPCGPAPPGELPGKP